jgi:hypothetical protein
MLKTIKELFRCLFSFEVYRAPIDFTYFTSEDDAKYYAALVGEVVEMGCWKGSFPDNDGKVTWYHYRVFTNHNKH